MFEQPGGPRRVQGWGMLFFATIVVITAVFTCSIYANLSFRVTNRKDLENFPPFKPHHDANHNVHLGAEYFNIARSIYAGKGFSSPFNRLESGPTAWMPPVLPYFLAALLWICEGDRDLVMAVVVFLQVYTLIATGFLVLVLARQTTARLWTFIVLVILIVGMVSDFHSWFQFTHDCWLILLVLDLLVAGLVWLRPLNRWHSAAGWGLFGGFCALVNPIIAFTWGVMTFLAALHQRSWSRLGVAVLAAGLVLTPWTVRNFLVFGRLIPVKPNLAFELYQSQCLQPDGLLQGKTFGQHPNNESGVRERKEYISLGESVYLDHKREQFLQAVRANPNDFLKRIGDRFFGATLWYESMDRQEKVRRPWVFWWSRTIHPLPFLAFLGLVLSAVWKRLPWAQWAVMGVYVIYLFPYIGVSYYDRYATPLLGVKVLLVVWAVDSLLSLLPRMAQPRAMQGRSRTAGASRTSRAVSVSH